MTKEDKKALGRGIRGARRVAGLTQAELAERIGVPQSRISEWECGAHAPGGEMLRQVQAELGADLVQNEDMRQRVGKLNEDQRQEFYSLIRDKGMSCAAAFFAVTMEL